MERRSASSKVAIANFEALAESTPETLLPSKSKPSTAESRARSMSAMSRASSATGTTARAFFRTAIATPHNVSNP